MATTANQENLDAKGDGSSAIVPGEGGTNEVQILKAKIAQLEKEKEQAEREIDARMRSVDKACIVSETDLKGYITYVNDKHCEVSQYSREELLGSNQNIVRHPDMPKEVFKEMWSTIGKGQIFQGLVKNRRKDGTPYYVDGIFTPVMGENGKPVKYIGIRYDVTEVTLESQRMKGIVDAINESYAFIEFDIKGNIISANDNFLTATGYTTSEIVGKHHRIFVEPSFANSLDYQAFWRDLENGKIHNDEFKRVKKNGDVIYLQAVYSPVKDDMGRIVKVVKIATDITSQVALREEAKQAAEELKTQEEELRQNMEEMQATQEEIQRNSAAMKGILNAIDNAYAYIEFDTQGNILTANDIFLKTTEYTAEELRGKHHRIFVDPKFSSTSDYQKFWTDLANGFENNNQFKRLSKSGKEIWLQAVYSPIKDVNGKVSKVIKIATDITEQKRETMNAIALSNTVDNSYARIEFDVQGNILFANSNFVNTLGYLKSSDIIGQHHSLFVEPSYAKSQEYRNFWTDLANGITQEGQFKRLQKDGTEIWIQAAYTPVKNEEGRVFKVIKIATNITEQKRNNLATEQAAAEVSRVVVAMANGDLTQLYSVDSKGDLKEMGSSLNRAIENLNNLLGNISQIANLVAASSEELLTKGEQMKGTTMEVASATQQMAEGAQQQAQQTDESSKLIDMALKSSNEMGKKADVISNVAERALKSAQDGLVTIKRVVDNMNEIQESAKTTSGSISILTQRSEEIARTLNVITDIAAQTNLLALNAAIEAARAGDAGRGFAVVAEEIRKLAEDSRKSAVDIEKVIREVQKDINSAGKSIESMETSVKNGNSASREAEVVFNGIQSASSENFEMSKQIIDATENQKEVITNTVKNIEKIVVVSEETASGTEEIASSTKELSQGMNEVTATSRDLADVAAQLQQSVSKFKLKK